MVSCMCGYMSKLECICGLVSVRLEIHMSLFVACIYGSMDDLLGEHLLKGGHISDGLRTCLVFVSSGSLNLR